MSDDNDLHYFGSALPQLQIDDLPAKRAPYVEEQVAKDEYGRRRFHGAFTGGFSAGHWNTVGSQEGWQPQDYTSSRAERAPQRQTQRPEDYMDAEDLGEFGIAPQRLQAQDDFAVMKTRKRKFPTLSSGPIPGVPVLAQICAPVQDKVAIRILKNMGWRPGQGVGPRQTQKQKKTAAQLNKREMYLMEQYGFQPPKREASSEAEEGVEEEDTDEDEDITFAPEDYDPFVIEGKENRFGLGYSGLQRDALLGGQHFTLFEPMQLLDKTQQRKFTISGQAFGVGALEEEDEDIYTREDMTNYDFSLEERQRNAAEQKKQKQDKHIVEGFVEASEHVQYTLPYKIDLPSGWKPRNWSERRSRFAPLKEEKVRELQPQISVKAQKAGLGRHDMTPSERGALLLESIVKQAHNFQTEKTPLTQSESEAETPEQVKATVEKEHRALLQKCSEKTKALEKSSLGFQPFKQNEHKQERYDKFLESKLQKEPEIRAFLSDFQPIKMSEWEREMEMKEFIQARKIYKPLDSIMSDRFVTEGSSSVLPAQTKAANVAEEEEEQKKIKIERSKNMWKPCAALCKRYNIPEPYGKHEVVENELETQLKNQRNKTNIFDFISLNKKSDFQTPVIIPKHMELAPKLVEPVKIMGLEQMKATLQAQEAKSPVVVIKEKPQFKPQTELEKRVEATKHVAVPQKQELFKAIFDSDDDDDEEKEKNESDEVTIKTKEMTVEENEAEMLKNAKQYKLLGTNSPPRGIFSALFQAQQEKNTKTTTATTPMTPIAREHIEKIKFQPKLAPEFYGPAVPSNLGVKKQKESSKLLQKAASSIEDEWVEKSALESGTESDSSDVSKKQHKIKKHKKQHKKHKKHKKHKNKK